MAICTVFLQSQEEHDHGAGEGPIDADGENGDGESELSSSENGESFGVSSVVDLDPELQAIKGSPVEISFVQLDTTPDCDLKVVNRRVNASSETTTLKIQIPMSVDKRKRGTLQPFRSHILLIYPS